MADIDVQRKEGGSAWIWWILGLIVLALLIWWLVAANDRDDVATVAAPVATDTAAVAAPVAPVAPMAGEQTPAGGATIATVLANPSAYYGQPFSTGTVTAGEVVGDRSFWITGDNGERLLVVKNESPAPGTADAHGPADMRASRNVNQGEKLQINGTLYDATNMNAVQPPLDAQTKQAMQGVPIFLQANVADIQHM